MPSLANLGVNSHLSILIFIKWILRVFCMINHGLLILIDYCCGTLLYQSGHFYNSRFNGVFRSGTFDRETCVDNLIIIVFFFVFSAICSICDFLYDNLIFPEFTCKSLKEDQGNSAEDVNSHCLSLWQCIRTLKRKTRWSRFTIAQFWAFKWIELQNGDRGVSISAAPGEG